MVWGSKGLGVVQALVWVNSCLRSGLTFLGILRVGLGRGCGCLARGSCLPGHRGLAVDAVSLVYASRASHVGKVAGKRFLLL